jgi:hypothetical protein
MKSSYYEFYVVVKDGKVRLHITADCPIAHTRKGQCSGCDQFLGLNPEVKNEGLCKAKQMLIHINGFRNPRMCKDPSKCGDCTKCNKFMGFANNGFYCAANTKK